MIHRKALSPTTSLILQGCWIVGQEYSIPEFQDTAMIGLLQIFEKPASKLTSAEINSTSFINPFFKLRELLIEEIVKSLYYHDMNPDELDLDELDGVDFFSNGSCEDAQAFHQGQRQFLRQIH